MSETTFKERLFEAFNGASDSEIARLIGVSHTTIGKYGKGALPGGDVLIQIEKATKVSLSWLLTGQGPKFLGDADRFDIEASIEKHGNWDGVLKEWYEFEGVEMPEFEGALFMGGWDSFDYKKKVLALVELKKVLDMHVEKPKEKKGRKKNTK